MAKIVDEIMMALKRQPHINRVIVGKREYIAIGKEIDDLRHFPFRPSASDILPFDDHTDPVVEIAKVIAKALGKPAEYQSYIGAAIQVCGVFYPVKDEA